jgi:protein involved in polysaccharide export with SLBB domain
MKTSMRLLLLLALLILPASFAADEAIRKIIPGDILVIRIANEPDLTQQRTVGTDGKIKFWILDEMDVRDKSTSDVERELREKLDKDYIINPGVSVEVLTYAKQYINVMGQVLDPGRKELPVDRRITIVDALSMGRGFTPRANQSEVVLIRKGQKKTYSKKDIDKMMERGEQIFMEPDDTINVGESIF